MAWTNLGKEHMFAEFFASGTVDDTFRLILCSAVQVGSWDADTSSTADLSAVSSLPGTNSNGDAIGGTSGLVIVRDASADGANFHISSAFQVGGADSSAVRAVLQTGNDAFQFSGEFNGARYAVLVRAGDQGSAFDFSGTTENVYAWWDIGQETNISDGNTLTITSLSLQGQ